MLRRIGGSTFVTGEQPGGFGAEFFIDDNGTISARLVLPHSKQGAPGYAHGGSLATLIDEAMGASAWNQGYRALTANLNFDYRKPVPLGVEIHITGEVVRRDGRKVYTRGEILLPDGSIAVEATGLFITLPEQLGDDGPHIFTPL